MYEYQLLSAGQLHHVLNTCPAAWVMPAAVSDQLGTCPTLLCSQLLLTVSLVM